MPNEITITKIIVQKNNDNVNLLSKERVPFSKKIFELLKIIFIKK